MEILVFSQYFYPENFRINSLCDELVRRGYGVTVVTGYPNYPAGKIFDGYGLGKKYERCRNGVNIIRLPMFPRGKRLPMLLLNVLSYIFSGYIWTLFNRKKFDLVYFFGLSPVITGLPAVFFKNKNRLPLVSNIQDLWPESMEQVLGIKNRAASGIINVLIDHLYKQSDLVLCTSKSFVKNITARGHDEEKVVYWPQFFESAEGISEEAERPAEFSRGFNIVFAGNIGEAQGLEAVIDAAAMLRGDVHWYLIGDGRARAELMRRAESRKVQRWVHFLGKKPEAECLRYIKCADCALLPLKYGGILSLTIPAKFQTYLSCGVPVLAAACGEVSEITVSEGCGVYAEPENPAEISAAVLKLMNMPEDKRREIGLRARECFNKNFRKDRLTDELEIYFSGLTAERSATEGGVIPLHDSGLKI